MDEVIKRRVERFKHYVAMNPAFSPRSRIELDDAEWKALLWCAETALDRIKDQSHGG